MTEINAPPTPNPLCGVDNGQTEGYGNVTIQCADPNVWFFQGLPIASIHAMFVQAVIDKIDFAAFGTPSGTCGNYQHNASCDAAGVTAYVTSACVGKNYCSVLSYPTFGDPCYQVYKQFIIQV